MFVSERTLSRKRVTAQISVSCKLNTQPTFEFSLQLFEFISKIGFSASICNRKGLTTRFMSNLGFCCVEFYLMFVILTDVVEAHSLTGKLSTRVALFALDLQLLGGVCTLTR